MTNRQPVNGEVRQTQIDPIAGVWTCPNCGRSIQLITDSDVAKKQAFTCVCGTSMQPGEEHATLGEGKLPQNG